jgi:hypothetical protein
MSWFTDAFSRVATRQVSDSEQLRIPDDHVIGGGDAQVLLAERDYFVVHVHEIELGYDRKFWQAYTPTVWTNVDFVYARQPRSVPFLIGPSLFGQPLPDDVPYSDVRVLGPVPYRGGPVTVSLVFSRVATGNAAAELLSVVESTAAAFGVSSMLAAYLALAGSVTHGLERLLHLGTEPLLAVRDTVAPDVPGAAETRTGWYALIDQPPGEPLWVIDRSLRAGPSAEQARPLPGRAYVLYSVASLPRDAGRNDIDSIADLAASRDLIERLAARPDADSWTAAETLFAELAVAARAHPDLTRGQAESALNEWYDRIESTHEQARRWAHKGGHKGSDETDRELDEITGLVLHYARQP